ncbi:hypothetical protein C8J56DRAFT_205385 [Mycena floridula]|nr:hypothetical protein C8J56DRAFT_205385 [Mycena floridula]
MAVKEYFYSFLLFMPTTINFLLLFLDNTDKWFDFVSAMSVMVTMLLAGLTLANSVYIDLIVESTAIALAFLVLEARRLWPSYSLCLSVLVAILTPTMAMICAKAVKYGFTFPPNITPDGDKFWFVWNIPVVILKTIYATGQEFHQLCEISRAEQSAEAARQHNEEQFALLVPPPYPTKESVFSGLEDT